MTPYYQDALVTIYHGDCREVLPALGGVDLVITDPPYRSLDIDVIRGGTTVRLADHHAPDRKAGKLGAESNWFATLDEVALLAVFAMCRAMLTEDGALYVFTDVKSGLVLFPRLAPANVLVWDKGRIGMGYNWRRMHEWIAYCPQPAHKLRSKALGDIVRAKVPTVKAHATEKPLDCLRPLILNSSDEGDTVCDPFSGSGSTLVAAMSLGRKSIGIEIEERYCEIAAERCRQEVLDFGGAA